MNLESYIRQLSALVQPCVGQELVSVVYGAIEGECGATDVADGVEWISGEVRLQFGAGPLLFVGWGENEGWQDHFSLAIQDVSTFKPETLVEFAADTAPEWRGCIGQRLVSVECRGSNNTPHALVFHFDGRAVVIGDGFEGRLGDGDDVIILSLDHTDLSELDQLFWSSVRLTRPLEPAATSSFP